MSAGWGSWERSGSRELGPVRLGSWGGNWGAGEIFRGKSGEGHRERSAPLHSLGGRPTMGGGGLPGAHSHRAWGGETPVCHSRVGGRRYEKAWLRGTLRNFAGSLDVTIPRGCGFVPRIVAGE